MDDNEPRNVKELLVEAKDASELLVDVAYAAVFFNDEDMADEVEKLEERMAGYLRRLRTLAILAARSPEDAEAIESVLWIANAIDKIGDAASDIARVVAAKLGIPDALRADLRHADEVCGRVKVREGSQAVGEQGDDIGDGAQDPPPGKGFRRRVGVGAGPFPRCAPSPDWSPV